MGGRAGKQGRLAKFGGFRERHDGREGDIRLINGKAEPQLTIAAGYTERWRIINASSARYIRLSLGGATFRIIGTDGGLIEAPVDAASIPARLRTIEPLADAGATPNREVRFSVGASLRNLIDFRFNGPAFVFPGCKTASRAAFAGQEEVRK